MSNQYFRTRFTCLQDCCIQGCPSHELILHIAHTSDTVAIVVDGEQKVVFGDSEWDAILRLSEQKPEDSFWPENWGAIKTATK